MTATIDLSGPGLAEAPLAPLQAVSRRAPAPGSLGHVLGDVVPEGETLAPLEFEQVYQAHFDFVWRSLRLLGVDAAALEDAAQDTFSVVARQLGGFEGRASLRTWLFSILQRVAANYRRKRRRKQTPLVPLIDAAADEPTPLAHVEAVEAARTVERFCTALEPERRALFVLAVLEELPAGEVSAALGLPIAKVYSRVHALREGLRRALAARGGEHG